MKKIKLFFTLSILVCSFIKVQAQTDTTQLLKEVVVRAYFSEQPILRSPASVGILDLKQLNNQPNSTLVSAINTVPGVRMEERSPGSYRLSIRGSLLRSPFGIRNVKMYMDEFPLTDAGGNTYLNLLDAGSVNGIEILKGPEASIFGANSGGVILINPTDRNADNSLSANINGGSYGLFHEKVGLQQKWKDYQLNISQAYQRSDGYRQNSALQRSYMHTAHSWNYSPKGQLRALLMYSDLNYSTPGGLTAAQMAINPRGARPAAGPNPGAIEQHAGIYNTTFMGGLLNETKFSDNLKHVVSVFGMHTDFKNPFLTNYEVRDENSLGLRTFLELSGEKSSTSWRWDLGLEAQQTRSGISNYANNRGVRGTITSSDRLRANQSFAFTHFTFDFNQKLMAEAAASINFYNYKYGGLYPSVVALKKKEFDPKIMPRLALSYQFNGNFAWRASASKGYSPPTIAEVRASNNVVNTDLQPENGWNYETGFRFSGIQNRLWLDAVVFNYRLQDAIVRRVDATDTEYFINAGGTRQLGFESQLILWLIKPDNSGFIRGLQVRNSYTLSDFSFRNYKNATIDYSGNPLTGVPKTVLVSSIEVNMPMGLYAFAQHNYTSKISLNDANTASADAYHLGQLKAGWKKPGTTKLEIYAGIDNLFNADYSLGNDLNAFGSRYFNPSPKRNYYFGIATNIGR